MDEPEMQAQARRDMWRDMDSGFALAAVLFTATALLMGAGWLADRWLTTEPWLMVTGALLGFALGMYLVFLHATELGEAAEAERLQRRRRTGGRP